MQKESPIREPLILGNKSYHDITVDVAKPVLAKANKLWWIVFGISVVLFIWWILSVGYTIGTESVFGVSTKPSAGHGTSPTLYGG